MSGDPGKVGEPPAHYVGKRMQPFDVIDAYRMGFYDGSALKYLIRYDKKGTPLADLKKALHYIEETIIRWEVGGFDRSLTHLPKQMHPEEVYRAFDLEGNWNVCEAVFYLLYWKISDIPGHDIARAKKFVEKAIAESENAS